MPLDLMHTTMELERGSKYDSGETSSDKGSSSLIGAHPGLEDSATGNGNAKKDSTYGIKTSEPVATPSTNFQDKSVDVSQDANVNSSLLILESSSETFVEVATKHEIIERGTLTSDVEECTKIVDTLKLHSSGPTTALSMVTTKDTTSVGADPISAAQYKNVDSVKKTGAHNDSGSNPDAGPSSAAVKRDQSDKATEELIRQHLADSGVTRCNDPDTSPWTLRPSPLGGRGVFAARDIGVGEVVGIDAPLVLGPRAGSTSQPMCVGCHAGDVPLSACSRGCGLPVCCKQCETSSRHVGECEILVRWRPNAKASSDWSMDLLRSATPLRCLALSPQKKNVMLSLISHKYLQHAFEVELIKRNVDTPPTLEEEEFLRQCCFALDANAYETVAHRPIPLGTVGNRLLNGVNTSLRGLYPLAAMLNHQCTPNTWHGYDVENRMILRATVDIPAGTEFTTSYTPLFWATLARRHYLTFTKHFYCNCPRCNDYLEGGTKLGALRCANDQCPGSILCMNPMNTKSRWQCNSCGLQMPGRQAAVIQSSLGCLLSSMDCRDPQVIEKFLDRHTDAIPTSNQVAVEMKCNLVWFYGHCKGYLWAELTDNMLDFKERLCRELLGLVRLLGAGQCRMKGLFLYELHCTLLENLRRHRDENGSQSNSSAEKEAIAKEALCAIQEAAAIFQDDITSPPDVWVRLHVTKSVMAMTTNVQTCL